MTAYDPTTAIRLVAVARAQYGTTAERMRYGTMGPVALRVMADQLEAAVAEVKRLYTLAIEQIERAILAEVEIDRMLGGRVEVELHVGQDPNDCDPPPAKVDHGIEAWRRANPDRDDMPVG